MKLAQFIVVIISAIILALLIILSLNHFMYKPNIEALSKSAVAQQVQNAKVPNSWLKDLPSSIKAQIPGAKKDLANQAMSAQEKYVLPILKKYQTGRFGIIAGLGVLIILVVLFSRFPALAIGMVIGSMATIIYAFISTWAYLGVGFRWLLLPVIIAFSVLIYWQYKKMRHQS